MAKNDIQTAFDKVGEKLRAKNVGGRPKKTVDPHMVFEMAALGLTIKEMAGVFGVSLPTMNRRLKETDIRAAYTRGKCSVQIALRHHQLKLALSGNTTMQIWLGKQYLGQKNDLIVKLMDYDLPEQEEGRVIHVPWTPELEAELKAIDAEFPELDGIA